jgi:hypothetical protein
VLEADVVIDPGDPTELDADLLYDAVVRGIRAGTTLHVLDENMLEDRTAPSPNLHRSVRIDPAQMAPTGTRARPGGELGLLERLVLTLTHDYSPGAHRASHALAAQDLRELLRAVLTRTEISGLASPDFAGRTIRRSGHQLEQLVTFTFSYEIELPAAAGPE